MKDLIPFVGRPTHRRVDEIFSRDVLGSVLISASSGKVVEKTILLFADTVTAQLVAWSFAFVAFTYLFVFWDRIESKKDDAVDAATDAIDDATDAVDADD